MRCGDLDETWAEFGHWLDAAGVLQLPPLEGATLTVKLDADIDPGRPATAEETRRALQRVQAVIERFHVPVVYVTRTVWDRSDEWRLGGDRPVPRDGPTAITVRVMAGGVLHELPLVAAWYAELNDLATAVNCAYAA
jgi:hypothetical protein